MKNQNLQNVKIEFYRLDYKNPSESGSMRPLTTLNNINDITDVNEISDILISGDFKFIIEQMPKSYNFIISNNSDGEEIMYVTFNTFWHNKKTGDINESACKNRLKIINKLKQIGF
jgi:hypothetical protein